MSEQEHPEDPDPREENPDEFFTNDQVRTFAREALVLLIGLGLGFFWRAYYEQVSNEAHIILFQLLIILGLARYIQLMQSGK